MMRGRVLAVGAVALVATTALGACSRASGTGGGATTATPTGPGVVVTTPVTPDHGDPLPLTCAQLREAAVTTATVKLTDYPFDSINLTDGRWAAEDGTEILLEAPCAIGDLVGDPAWDAMGVVKITAGGTGRFYSLVVWRNSGGSMGGEAVLAATLAIGDRNPVTDISIAGHQATVVYLTRTDDQPMAVLNVKRTAIFTVSGTTLHEVSHTDAPYTP